MQSGAEDPAANASVKQNVSRLRQPLAIKLRASQIFDDYQQAFQLATGLPLELQGSIKSLGKLAKKPFANPFCTLISRTNTSCAACLAAQEKLQRTTTLDARTLRCFAGLCETAVPIRVGNSIVAFLQTGQVLIDGAKDVPFSEISRALLQWGADVDLKKAEEAYFQSRVLSKAQYTAMVKLLSVFARHLSECGEKLQVEMAAGEPKFVQHAKGWAQSHSADQMSLADAARAVNMSSKYFGEKFKQHTGMGFSEYIARVRVEKAKLLLRNPNLRIGEIALESGFQSLSQFNRCFRKFTGQSPRDARKPAAR